ncbi:MAG: VOC family protein [Halieaceae bacterium]
MDDSRPVFAGVDHLHVYVKDRAAAADWYQQVLGFEPMEALAQWASGGGPLTLEDRSGKVHLALFESDKAPTSTIAFGASGAAFIDWRNYLAAAGLELRLADHELAWSLYFHDPDGNYHEITTYDHGYVSARLSEE